MKRAAVLGISILALAAPAGASAATTATITGANIDSAGAHVSVSNIQVHFDACGGFDSFSGYGGCGAKAGIVPATTTCPTDGTGIQVLWNLDSVAYGTSAPRTFNSGAKSISVTTPRAYRVCAYSIVSNSGGTVIPANPGIVTLRADALTPTPEPPNPPPSRGLTKRQAEAAAEKALKNKFGSKYSKGKQKKISCRKAGRKYNCDVSWKSGKNRYEGTVQVSGSKSNPHALVSVRKD